MITTDPCAVSKSYARGAEGPALPSPTSPLRSYNQLLPQTMNDDPGTRNHDASNFDDYLVVGLVAAAIIALFAAYILL